jgi:DNA-binding CsgD family transcriptional regulator
MTTILEEEQELMTDDDLRRDLRIEGLLNEWNIPFDFDSDYPVRKLDANYDESQVREIKHRAPQENVNEYAIQMRAGAIFPPIVATHNGRMIDGNTRKGACDMNGVDTFPVYLVKLPQASYGPMIGAALNQMGGKRLTDEEAFLAAETMIRNGHSDEAIARTIGKSAQSVRNYRRQTRYKDAAERTGVSEMKVTATTQRALADIKLDEPFKEAVQLVSTAKLPLRDVQEMVSRLEDTRSEAQALDVIQEIRTKVAPAGPPPHKKNLTKPATDAGRKIDAFLASVKVPPAELAPTALRADLEPKWKQLHELAGAVLLAFAENGAQVEIESETEAA